MAIEILPERLVDQLLQVELPTLLGAADFQRDAANSTAQLGAVAAAARLAPQLAAAADEASGAFTTHEFAWLRETGMLQAGLPFKQGGAALGAPTATLPLLQVLRHIGRGNLAVGALYESHLNALVLLQLFGTAEQVARCAADTSAGYLFGMWNAEDPAEGVRLQALPNGRYRLHGVKTGAAGAGLVTRPLLTGAQAVGRGWQLFLLPESQQPVLLEQAEMSSDIAAGTCRIDLSGLEIGPEDLVGEPNAYYDQPWFSEGAIRLAAVQLGGAEALFEETCRFLQLPNDADESVQYQYIEEMAGLLDAGQQWLRGAATSSDQRNALKKVDETVDYANSARTAIEKICLRMLALAERCASLALPQAKRLARRHRSLTQYLAQTAADASLADTGRH